MKFFFFFFGWTILTFGSRPKFCNFKKKYFLVLLRDARIFGKVSVIRTDSGIFYYLYLYLYPASSIIDYLYLYPASKMLTDTDI